MNKRESGVLLHITSLPGTEGIGTLGREAFRFVDFLAESGQKIWQILPLGPAGAGNSPYQCYSAFAGNPLLIDLQLLADEKLLVEDSLCKRPRLLQKRVDFKKVENWKLQLLKQSYKRFKADLFENLKHEYWRFLDEHAWWLNDYALFMAARLHFNTDSWNKWPDPVKFRHADALRELTEELADEIEFQKYLQFLFFRQWYGLKRYANSKHIDIIGDVPLYVSGESSDIWANTDIFLLDENLKPTGLGGVPPDYFSETGQLWGNPVFDWGRLAERDYDWWLARLHFNLRMFNRVRIDHFRGLEAFWIVPSGEKTAENGTWLPAHGKQLMQKMKEHLGTLPFIAEDLGIITPEVDLLREEFGLPGMKVLQFAFTTDAANKDLPHNYSPDCVVYTGTHDNDTTLGWLKALKGDEKQCLELYTGAPAEQQLDKVLEMAMASVAKTAIVPMQDLLELDSSARMNMPGTANGNWDWRFQWKQLKVTRKKHLRALTLKYNR